MKIGYSVEGSTDRAVLAGLRDRWCNGAELVEGHFRGQTGLSRRREVPRICRELSEKGVTVTVLLTDANDDPGKWRKVQQAERARVPEDCQHLAVVGVCQRNVECWLCADRNWIAQRTGRNAAEFTAPDPKSAFESAMGITGKDRKEAAVAELARAAPLQHWLRNNRSFEDFYDQLREKARTFGCPFENLREAQPG